MAPCSFCRSKIAFGGVTNGPRLFCNETCRQKGADAIVAQLVSPDEVAFQLSDLRKIPCSLCGGPGPVDIHTSHHIWSFIIITSHKNVPQLCCYYCGRKAKGQAALSCFFLGWWGFPWGLVLTPIQLFHNLLGIINISPDAKPSAELQKMVRLKLAADVYQAEDRGALSPPPLPQG